MVKSRRVAKMTRDVTTNYPATTTYSTWPYVLSLIGGVLILIEGIIIAVAGPFLFATAGDLGLGALIFGIVVVIHGLIIIWAAYSLRANPVRHVAYGAVIVIVSVLALVLAGGGFVIGSILGIIGGAWAIMRA
jgi:hypothetical protein